jgi:adenosine deaminase
MILLVFAISDYEVTMSLDSFIKEMPKVELHVHMEGSIRPATLLKLAKRHGIEVPANDVEGLRDWYTFTDFDHFIDIYRVISRCLRTYEDIETIAREFLIGQAEQNIRYSEVTYTAFSQFYGSRLSFKGQMAAINRARTWAAKQLDTHIGLVIDIPRIIPALAGRLVAHWAVSGMDDGVCALGLGGPEVGNPPERYKAAFDLARRAGLPSVPHAGETMGPESMWGALNSLHAVRLGHGVRCLEDPALVAELRRRQIPLEVCPTSNVCLKVVPDLASHPLPKLLEEGLYVTLNSDDPPMFNTTLTAEYQKTAEAFGFDADAIEKLVFNALHASFLPDARKQEMEREMQADFKRLRTEHLGE